MLAPSSQRVAASLTTGLAKLARREGIDFVLDTLWASDPEDDPIVETGLRGARP